MEKRVVGRLEGIHESEREKGYGACGGSHKAGGVVLPVTEPRDEPSGGGGGVDPNKECEGRVLKRDHRFSTMPTVPNCDLRRYCNTREQSHRGHYFTDNPRLRPTR